MVADCGRDDLRDAAPASRPAFSKEGLYSEEAMAGNQGGNQGNRSGRSRRGFAAMGEDEQRQIARKGGQASARSQRRDSQGQFAGSDGSSGSGGGRAGGRSGGSRGGNRR
jgi:hypothetical protein